MEIYERMDGPDFRVGSPGIVRNSALELSTKLHRNVSLKVDRSLKYKLSIGLFDLGY